MNLQVHLHPTPSAGQSSNVSRLGRFGQKQFPDHLTIRTSHRVTKQVQPSLDELYRYSCKTKAAHYFHRWYALRVDLCVGR